ncbi:BTB/POZ domain-containing protein At3g50780 [Andrographis paniculata]|uniref:BTB/POZ domain-containing protein At3g50780 n=1 Tax=Andrographis paniculata TaxID=175694 RepID=UPI0021E8F5E9|nr:BTB/POZ domain-containing protein At3g50780 [Andrographis paniculata]
MAEIRVPRLEKGQTKIKNVPIAVTPEGFWCCPSPGVFQKPFKPQPSLNKAKQPSQNSSIQPKKVSINEVKSGPTNAGLLVVDEKRANGSDAIVLNAPLSNEKAGRPGPNKVENMPRKVTIEYGEAGTGDLKVILLGKQGITVKLSVHRSILVENSSFFATRISEQQPVFPCLEIDNCDDVEIYAETIGLMYCQEMKQQLIKQSVPRVLRILKVGERLGFTKCIRSCLEYLEAVPWVGEDEEEKVVASVTRLEGHGIGVGAVLKRVSSVTEKPPKDTLCRILELVLESKEEKGRREMKSIVLKLLRGTSSSSADGSCNETIFAAFQASLDSLLSLFRQAAEAKLDDKPMSVRETAAKPIALQADNLLWMLDILSDRQAGDDVAVIWANQRELVSIHSGIPVVVRHYVSLVSARIFVLIGQGAVLSCKETRHSLLNLWLPPLIDDYKWLQHGCRLFDRDVVEEGIGRTILTLPMEDQRALLLSWLGSFLTNGDGCPNLQRAFEVWWRRALARPAAAAAARVD